MRKLVNIAKWGATLGREPQNFLSAGWVLRVLERSPASKKRKWALRLLSLSPHYFINPDDPKYRGMAFDDYLEAVFADVAESRRKIFEQILKPHLHSTDTVLDYGCGPGFLARAIAPNVARIVACDISTGALACARVLNAAPNLEYITADSEGSNSVADQSIDAVVSFAMVQHLSDDVFAQVLATSHRKLKPGGRLVLHIQLIDDEWRTEDEWRSDTSIKGRMKYKYGLHCFGRTAERHREMVENAGFGDIVIREISEFVPEHFDDVCSQSLLIAEKPRID